MYTVRVIRKDSTTPATYQRVKHAWRQGDELVLSMGQHGVDRVYVHWPIGHVDHYEVEETADAELPGRHA
jgi:hypothetical protein